MGDEPRSSVLSWRSTIVTVVGELVSQERRRTGK